MAKVCNNVSFLCCMLCLFHFVCYVSFRFHSGAAFLFGIFFLRFIFSFRIFFNLFSNCFSFNVRETNIQLPFRNSIASRAFDLQRWQPWSELCHENTPGRGITVNCTQFACSTFENNVHRLTWITWRLLMNLDIWADVYQQDRFPNTVPTRPHLPAFENQILWKYS